MLELKATNHRYYCNETNYYVDGHSNYGRCDYDTWQDFKDEWLDKDLGIDDDYNHCFRFDITEGYDENDDPNGELKLWLFFILQRKGIYRPVQIKSITQDDMDEIDQFLSNRFGYLMNQWQEFLPK